MRELRLVSVLTAAAALGFVWSARAQTDAPAAAPSASVPPLPAPTVSAPPAATASPVPTSAGPDPVVATAPAHIETTHPSEHVAEQVDDAPKKQTDHDKVVGRFGIGYFGQFDVPLGFTGARQAGPTEAAQLLGVRYWFQRVRLDIAVGMNIGAGTQTVGDAKTDQVSTLVFVGRVGLPIALYVDDHYTFFIGPEIAYGRSGETVPAGQSTIPGATPIADTSHSGSRFSIGGRAGAEIQFGFLGIPRLALDATVGLALDVTSGQTEGPDRNAPAPPGQPVPTINADYARTSFRSSTQHQPWNIFISNVAAVYYF